MDFIELISTLRNGDQAKDLLNRACNLVNIFRNLNREYTPAALSVFDNTRSGDSVRELVSDISECDVNLSDLQNGLNSIVHKLSEDQSDKSYLNLCSLNIILCRLTSSQEQYLVCRERFFGAESLTGKNDFEVSLIKKMYEMKDICEVNSRKHRGLIGLEQPAALELFVNNFVFYHNFGHESANFFRYISGYNLSKLESYRVARGDYYLQLHHDDCVLAAISHWVSQPSLSCHLRIGQFLVGQYLETFDNYISHRMHGDNLAKCYGDGVDLLRAASETATNLGRLSQDVGRAFDINIGQGVCVLDYFGELLVCYDSFFAGCLLLGHIGEFLSVSPYRHFRVDEPRLKGHLLEICEALQHLIRFPPVNGSLDVIPGETYKRFYGHSHHFLAAELHLIKDRIPKLKKFIDSGFPDGDVEINFGQPAEFWWVVLPYYGQMISILSQFSFVFLELCRRSADFKEVRRTRVRERFQLFHIYMAEHTEGFITFFDELQAGREAYKKLEDNTRLLSPRVVVAELQAEPGTLSVSASEANSPGSAVNLSSSTSGSAGGGTNSGGHDVSDAASELSTEGIVEFMDVD